MDIFVQLVNNIIQAQENVVGPLAVEQAKRVGGIKLANDQSVIGVDGDKKAVVDQLIKQYEGLFGRASVEVCRQAVKNIITAMPKEQIPSLLS